MRIRHLHAQNYKSLKDVRVTFENLTVFIGPNGAGKSNILDCLEFISDACRENLDYAVITQRQGMSAVRHWSAKGRPFNVQVELGFDASAKPQREVQDRPHSQTSTYSLSLGSHRRGEYKVKSELYLKSGKSEKRSIREKYTPENSLALRFARSQELLELYRFLFRSVRYSIYPDSLREPQKLANDRLLLSRGENLASVVRRMRSLQNERFGQLKNALRSIVPSVEDVTTKQVGSYLSIVMTHLEQDGRAPSFDLGMESDGTIRALALLTALYHSEVDRFLAIEEPEQAIHPGAVKVMAEVLLEASDEQQIVVTTHDPEMLDYFPVESIRLVRMDGLSTIVEPVSQRQIQGVRSELYSTGDLARAGALRGDSDM